MEAAVDVKNLSRAVVEEAIRDGAGRLCDVGCFAHLPLREETVRKLFLKDGFDLRDHVGANDAGLNFENENALRRKAGGISLCGHRKAGL